MKKVVSNSEPFNGTTLFFYDEWQLVEEQDAAGDMVAQYVYGHGIDDVLQMKRDVKAPAGLEAYYYHNNTIGSVEKLTDDAPNAVVEEYDYGVFGSVTEALSLEGLSNPFRWQGSYYDPEWGGYYFRNRHYDPTTGRFLQRDPLGIWGVPKAFGNAYGHSGSNYVNAGDPLGLFYKSIHKETTIDKIREFIIAKVGEEPPDFVWWGEWVAQKNIDVDSIPDLIVQWAAASVIPFRFMEMGHIPHWTRPNPLWESRSTRRRALRRAIDYRFHKLAAARHSGTGVGNYMESCDPCQCSAISTQCATLIINFGEFLHIDQDRFAHGRRRWNQWGTPAIYPGSTLPWRWKWGHGLPGSVTDTARNPNYGKMQDRTLQEVEWLDGYLEGATPFGLPEIVQFCHFCKDSVEADLKDMNR